MEPQIENRSAWKENCGKICVHCVPITGRVNELISNSIDITQTIRWHIQVGEFDLGIQIRWRLWNIILLSSSAVKVSSLGRRWPYSSQDVEYIQFFHYLVPRGIHELRHFIAP